MKHLSLLLTVLLVTACAGNTEDLTLWSGEKITFPNGTVFGGASSEQMSRLAKIFVQAHNATMQELRDLREENRRTAEQALGMLEDISKRQGSGEITIFFKTGSAALPKGSMEYRRLVRFLDYLARESHGRKILLVSIGSASAFGNPRVNARLARRRAKAPVAAIERYLVNTPHEFYQVYSVGDRYSPRDVPMQVQKNYQHTRIIAVFEADQLPGLPASND